MSTRCAVCLLTDERVHAVVLESRGRQRQVTGHGSTPLRLPDSLLADHDVMSAALATLDGELSDHDDRLAAVNALLIAGTNAIDAALGDLGVGLYRCVCMRM